jgi:hypothetical protein
VSRDTTLARLVNTHYSTVYLFSAPEVDGAPSRPVLRSGAEGGFCDFPSRPALSEWGGGGLLRFPQDIRLGVSSTEAASAKL